MAVEMSLAAIRSEASPQSYTRGNTIYKQGRLQDFHAEREGRYINASARVEGSYGNEYEVSVTYDERRGLFSEYSCECQAFETYGGMCKHCVAVALELLEWYQYSGGYVDDSKQPSGEPSKKSKRSWQSPTEPKLAQLIYLSSMQEKARYFQPEETGRVELEPVISMNYNYWKVEFKIGIEKKYVLKNITKFAEAIRRCEWVEYGKRLAFFHDRSIFTEESQKIVDFLGKCVSEEGDFLEGFYKMSYQYRDTPTERYLSLTPDRMTEFAEIMCGRTLETNIEDVRSNYRTRKTELTFVKQDPVLTVEVENHADGGYVVTVPEGQAFRGIQRMCVRIGSYVYLCSDEFTEQMSDFCRLMTPDGSLKHYMNPDDLLSFCASVLPVLEANTILKKPDSIKQYAPQPCQIAVYLDQKDEDITARLCARYGEKEYDLTEELTASDMHRDIRKEQEAVRLSAGYFGYVDRKTHLLYIPAEEDEKIYQLLSTGISQFQKIGEVFISDAMKRMAILRAPKVTVGVSLKAGLLDITLQSDHLPAEELEALLSSYRLRKKYYRLKSGEFIELSGNSLSAVAELAEGLNFDADDLASGCIHVPEYRSFYLDKVFRDNEEGIEVKRNQAFKSMLRTMRNVGDSDYEIPSGLQAELRPYQKFGFRWLMTLDQLGFGGILADDMGLGKTLQAVAYLLARKEQGNAEDTHIAESDRAASAGYRSLIVCPASLVYNWESEIHRFAPGLSVETVTGNTVQRRDKLLNLEADIVLTSYDLLKRDIEQYTGRYFDCMIIDEAQNIKNHTTMAAKAVKSIECGRRFALTGTPIENTLSELWSIFDFLMPGILGSYKKFKDHYEQPIAVKHDAVAAARLTGMVRPFILRRLKKDVLKELPDKLEEVVYSLMEETQREVYTANAQRVLDSLARQTPEEFKTGKIQILSELTRLRQLCCDPSLVYDNYKGGAAKTDTCMELIKNAVDAGNQILVFSQFTTMLDILKKRLEDEKIAYYILTGATSKEKRMELVNAFNSDGTPVFLISLKAGGTGLNLTAASIVIHFDPWWNQAAQNQATDRAHRIGQRQVVTVYKLIMKDTVEEKILKLQEQKADLSDEIMAEGSLNAAVGTREEFMEMLGSGLEASS